MITSKIIREIIHIQNNFIGLTKLPAYFLDLNGNIVQKKTPILCEFCKLIRESSKGEQRCKENDIKAGMEALKIGRPYYYMCHAGIPSVTIPCSITPENTWFIALGQILLSSPTNTSVRKVRQIASDLNIKEDLLIEAYKKIRIITPNEFKSAVNLLWDVTKFLCSLENKKEVALKLKGEKLRRSILELKLKEMQIKMLESQIRPHFLFNILNTISMLALLEKAKKTHEMISLLGRLLYYILYPPNGIVPLYKELEVVDTYLKLQSIRFGERLSYLIKVDKGIYNVKIPFLTLQPLVENSVVHGIEPKKEGGNIEVRGFKNNDEIVIEIEDNGVGISKAKLSTINNNDKGSFLGLGIQNVKERLTHYLGSNYKLTIESNKGKGTKVKLVLKRIM